MSDSRTMRVVAARAYDAAPDLMDLPIPRPGPEDVLVRLSAAGVNPADWKALGWAASGEVRAALPFVLGFDGAGTAERVGPEVRRFREGDRLFGNFQRIPLGSTGTYAQYALVAESNRVERMPEGLSFAEAAAAPIPAMTALVALDWLALKPGQTLLVIGATGGVGSFAVQFGSASGLRVLATARGEDSDYARRLGAAETFDWRRAPVSDQIRATHSEGVDGLLDVVSDVEGFRRNAELVRDGGAASSTIVRADAMTPLGSNRRATYIDMATGPADLLPRVRERLVAGELSIPLGATFPLDRTEQAWERMRRGPHQGRVTLEIP
jgi:NADPH2:quinone reductase